MKYIVLKQDRVLLTLSLKFIRQLLTQNLNEASTIMKIKPLRRTTYKAKLFVSSMKNLIDKFEEYLTNLRKYFCLSY